MTGRAEADILRRYGVGLLLVGDPYQLPPINEDGPILAPLGTATVELDVVMRADGDKQDLLAAYAFFRGSSDLRTGQDTPNVQVRHISTAKPEEMFGAGAILSTTNSDVQMVNSTYRAALGLSGMDPQVGERVILTSNIDAPKGLVNGALFYVASCEEISNGYRLEVVPSDVVEVRIGLESPYEIFQAVPDLVKELRAEDEATLSERIGSGAAPNIITIPATLHKSGFDCDHMAADKEFCKRAMRLSDMHFGYGLTVHKVQGSEFSKVVFYENSWWPKRTAQDEFIYRCLVYTAMTRGKSQIWAFTKRCQYYGKKVDQHEAA
ncbi:MAG: hypothetical protein COA62_15765 [Rhodobiaceae bacterium]|nr:MAG: hypothetical protein COA62_15765 [Rhodobiaceae bacterium]